MDNVQGYCVARMCVRVCVCIYVLLHWVRARKVEKCSLMAVLTRLSSQRKIIDFRVTFSKMVVTAYTDANANVKVVAAESDQGDCGEAYAESQSFFCGDLRRAGDYRCVNVGVFVAVCESVDANMLLF